MDCTSKITAWRPSWIHQTVVAVVTAYKQQYDKIKFLLAVHKTVQNCIICQFSEILKMWATNINKKPLKAQSYAIFFRFYVNYFSTHRPKKKVESHTATNTPAAHGNRDILQNIDRKKKKPSKIRSNLKNQPTTVLVSTSAYNLIGKSDQFSNTCVSIRRIRFCVPGSLLCGRHRGKNNWNTHNSMRNIIFFFEINLKLKYVLTAGPLINDCLHTCFRWWRTKTNKKSVAAVALFRPLHHSLAAKSSN